MFDWTSTSDQISTSGGDDQTKHVEIQKYRTQGSHDPNKISIDKTSIEKLLIKSEELLHRIQSCDTRSENQDWYCRQSETIL